MFENNIITGNIKFMSKTEANAERLFERTFERFSRDRKELSKSPFKVFRTFFCG